MSINFLLAELSRGCPPLRLPVVGGGNDLRQVPAKPSPPLHPSLPPIPHLFSPLPVSFPNPYPSVKGNKGVEKENGEKIFNEKLMTWAIK